MRQSNQEYKEKRWQQCRRMFENIKQNVKQLPKEIYHIIQYIFFSSQSFFSKQIQTWQGILRVLETFCPKRGKPPPRFCPMSSPPPFCHPREGGDLPVAYATPSPKGLHPLKPPKVPTSRIRTYRHSVQFLKREFFDGCAKPRLDLCKWNLLNCCSCVLWHQHPGNACGYHRNLR